MRVSGGGVDFRFEFSTELLVDEVLDAVGRFVHVVQRHPQVFDQIGLPQAVGTDQAAGHFSAPGT